MDADLTGWLDTALFKLGNATITPGVLITLLAIAAACLLLSSLVEAAVRRWSRRDPGRMPPLYALSRILKYFIWVVGFMVALGFAGIDLTALAVVGGALGVGIGFGLQGIVNNFVCGLVILLEGTLRLGDFVDLESGVRGHVRAISLRYTKVTTNDEIDVIVPNSEFVNGRVINWTLDSRNRRVRVPFSVAYGTDKETVRKAAMAAAGRVHGVLDEPGHKPDVWLVKFGDSALEFELVAWVGPGRVARPSNTVAACLWEIETELRAAGIEVPFPQRDLHLRSGPIEVRVAPSEGAEGAPADEAKAPAPAKGA